MDMGVDTRDCAALCSQFSPPHPAVWWTHSCCLCTQVRTAVTKSGCKMADTGSVLFNFQRQGLLFVPTSFSEDEASTIK